MSDRAPMPRDGWHTAFKGTLSIFTTAGVILLFFDPFDEKHFLRSVATSTTIQAVALCGAGILTVIVCMPLCVSFVRAYSYPEFRHPFPKLFPEKDGRPVVADYAVTNFVVVLITLGSMVYMSSYFGLRSYLPMFLHDMGGSEPASVPFAIHSSSYNKYCSGVTGYNPEFASERLCGVKLNGDLDDYYEKNIVLTGRRSPYGFRLERYVLPDIAQPTG